MPERLQFALKAIWQFPAKGAAVLLLVVILWEGDVARNDALPASCMLLLAIAFALLFFDRGFPVKVCVGLVIISFAARENYPFSHYPMYDRFTDHTFYVYIADGEGDPLPIQTLTGTRTSRIKKPYDKALDVVRKEQDKRKRELTPAECRAAGEAALLKLYEDATESGREKLTARSPIRLYHVNVFARDGKIDKQPPALIAELTLPPQ